MHDNMTKEELTAEIKRLQAELKALKIKEKRKRRYAMPDKIGEKYAVKYKGCESYSIVTFFQNTRADLDVLSKLIRRTCFESIKKTCKKGPPRTFAKQPDELTDEEYEEYTEVLDKILEILKEHSVKTKEEKGIIERGENAWIKHNHSAAQF